MICAIFADEYKYIIMISPKRYIQGFLIIVVALGWARELFPSLTRSSFGGVDSDSLTVVDASLGIVSEDVMSANNNKTLIEEHQTEDLTNVANQNLSTKKQNIVKEEVEFKPHRIYSVSSFKNSFPDQNDVQLVAAKKNGVKPVANRVDAEKRKNELVYVGSNPYFFVDKLGNSIPYLVPSAAVLLQDIGKTFYDSLQIKGIPLHKIIVTSVLRSREDVAKLQKRNFNATTQSCHQYGTTVDICYNRYKTVEAPDGPSRRAVTNDTLKWVLSEVLNDIRKQNRCFVKYEVKQGCFHLTVR